MFLLNVTKGAVDDSVRVAGFQWGFEEAGVGCWGGACHAASSLSCSRRKAVTTAEMVSS